MSDLADHTAATTAGYKHIQIDRGPGSQSPRYVSRYEKWMVGERGASGACSKPTASQTSL